MLPPTCGSFSWNSLLSYESCDTDEIWSKIWNTEPLWPCVSSCRLCRKTGSFCIFSMNSFFSWCSTTCALTQHVHRKTQKRRLFYQKMPNVLDIWQNMTDRTTYVIYFTNLKTDLTKDICEHDLWIQTKQSFLSVSVEIGWQQTFPFLKQIEQIDGPMIRCFQK